MPRIENLRCEAHANGYGAAFGTYCRDCIAVQEQTLRQYRDFQNLEPMPAALAEKLGVVPWKAEWDAEKSVESEAVSA